LKRLVDDGALRKSIASKALATVRHGYTLERTFEQMRAALGV
jgi:hypothetical protein